MDFRLRRAGRVAARQPSPEFVTEPRRPGPARGPLGPWATPSQAQLAGREVWQPPPWLPSQKGNHKQGVVQGQTRQHARLINLLGSKGAKLTNERGETN